MHKLFLLMGLMSFPVLVAMQEQSSVAMVDREVLVRALKLNVGKEVRIEIEIDILKEIISNEGFTIEESLKWLRRGFLTGMDKKRLKSAKNKKRVLVKNLKQVKKQQAWLINKLAE